MTNIIKRIKVFCETEQEYVEGYTLNDEVYCFNNKQHSVNFNNVVEIERISDSYTEKIVKWKMFCDTEQDYVYGYTNSSSSPLFCFNNKDHVIKRLPENISEYKNNNIKIQEELVSTGGRLISEGFYFNIPANSTQIKEISWFYNINVVNVSIYSVKEEIGNILNVISGPNTTIGTLATDTVIGGNGISVSDTVINNVYIGLEILINGEFISEIIEIDNVNKKLIFIKNLDKVYPSGAIVGAQRRVIKNYNLGFKDSFTVGTGKIGSSYLKKSTVVALEYKNNTSTEQSIKFNVEYLY